MTVRVAVPSRGRLREDALALLDHAGYRTSRFHGAGARLHLEGIEFIEMRPRDAAAWVKARRIDGAFLSTDLVLEEDLASLAYLPLGVARSELVLASRDDDGRASAEDLAGGVVATHLPRVATGWLRSRGIEAAVVDMGGALEGVCAAGLADGIVDLRETGSSLAQNRLRVLATITSCEALFVHRDVEELSGLTLRLRAVLDARPHRYVMLHVPRSALQALVALFPGLAAPTVLPLAGREDLVAVHLVVGAEELWARFGEMREVGATGIVALTPDALLR